MEKTSLLERFDRKSVDVSDEVDFTPSIHKTVNVYYDPLAKRKIKLEAREGEADLGARRVKVLDMFGPLDSFLMKNGGLRLDKAFTRSVEDLAMHVFEVCHKNPSKLDSIDGSHSHGHRRLSTKYTFLATVHLLLKARSLQSDGSFFYEISLGNLMSCYTHISLYQSTLAKYLSLVRQICKEEGRELGSANDKKKLFFVLSEKIAKIMTTRYRSLGIALEKDKLQKKLISNVHKFTVLHPDLLMHCIGSRPIAHHAFSVTYLSLITMLPRHVNLPVSDVLTVVKHAEQHLASLDYSSCVGCIMTWKMKCIAKFRAVCLAQDHKDPFLWSWRNYYKQNTPSTDPAMHLPDDTSTLPLRTTDDDASIYRNDTTTANSMSHEPYDYLGKRQQSTAAGRHDSQADLRGQQSTDIDSSPYASSASHPTTDRLTDHERSYVAVIVKCLLKSSTLAMAAVV